MSTRIVCAECIKKQEEIYRLREEIKRLKAQLRRQEREITEGYFGSSTPSSKKPVKKNHLKNGDQKNRGGAKVRHNGNGRRAVSAEQADCVQEVKLGCSFPNCHSSDLELLDRRERTVIDYEKKHVKKEKSHWLYHWVDNRDVPADNNFAERELRPLVMARKVSFGCHSNAGAKTRETLMMVLKTLKLRTKNDVRTTFANFLDQVAENPGINVNGVLFSK